MASDKCSAGKDITLVTLQRNERILGGWHWMWHSLALAGPPFPAGPHARVHTSTPFPSYTHRLGMVCRPGLRCDGGK